MLINANEPETYVGYWWLPDQPDLRVAGSLSFTPSTGVTLSLNGNFPEDRLRDPYGLTVLGESNFGVKMTVHQALRTQGERPGADSEAGASSFIANKAYIGRHFANPRDVVFRRVSYHPTYLENWLMASALDYDFTETGFSVKYVRPETVTLELPENLKLHIFYKSRGPTIDSIDTEVSFEVRPYFSIEPNSSQKWNAFGELIVLFNNFLSLGAMAPVHPLAVEAFVDTSEEEDEDSSTKVQVLLPLYEAPGEEKVRFFDMLFTYSDIGDSAEEYLRNWYEKRDFLEPVYDLFFGVLYSSRQSPVTTFLNYVQALETYHIRTQSDEYDPPDIHRERISAILDSAPEEHSAWLKEKLGFSNRKTLAQRLEDLIEINPRVVTGMAGSHEHFIQRVKWSRNYYTHYDPSLEGKAETGGALRGLSIVLGTMLEGILLIEMGLDVEAAHRLQQQRRRLPSAWY